MPLRRANGLSYTSMGRIYLFMLSLQEYDNQMFNIHRAVFCRETGRVFSDAINWMGKVRVDWTFLSKRYLGNYVSWGSLSSEQQLIVEQSHSSLAGFQTEFSSTQPSPQAIEPFFAYKRPGPLYVDIDTYVLLGWKIVPDTELEVLIVQKPLPSGRFSR